MILKELEILPEFLFGGDNLNNIKYADDSVDSRHKKETARTHIECSEEKQ